MRHDPASGAIIIMLRNLKMHGMAQAGTDLMEQGAPAFDAAVPMLAQLLKAELAEREGIATSYMTRILRLTLLAPDIVEAILDGKQGPEVTLARVQEPFPVSWVDQPDHFGHAG